jgi:hypothetical protein
MSQSALLLILAGQFTGKSEEVKRLPGLLVIDSSKIRQELGWLPRIMAYDILWIITAPEEVFSGFYHIMGKVEQPCAFLL